MVLFSSLVDLYTHKIILVYGDLNVSDSTTFMDYILKPLASSILFTGAGGGGVGWWGGGKTKHKTKTKAKQNKNPKPLIEVNGMFAGAKTAKDLGTGEIQLSGNSKVYGVFISILCNIPYIKVRFSFYKPKEKQLTIQKGYLGFLYHTYLYFRQILF